MSSTRTQQTEPLFDLHQSPFRIHKKRIVKYLRVVGSKASTVVKLYPGKDSQYVYTLHGILIYVTQSCRSKAMFKVPKSCNGSRGSSRLPSTRVRTSAE